jgi:hypothetical protein
VTTREKIIAVVDELRQTPAESLSDQGRDVLEMVQIAQGFGLDLFSMVIPSSDADADQMVDNLLTMLMQLRGDDLPPYSPDRYGEADLEPEPEPEAQPE